MYYHNGGPNTMPYLGLSWATMQTLTCRSYNQKPRFPEFTDGQKRNGGTICAQAWDAFDANTRGDLETGEEEAEENFLTDGDGMYVLALLPNFLHLDLSMTGTEGSAEMERESVTELPNTKRQPVQHQSPTKQKRKLLEELAEARDTKRRK